MKVTATVPMRIDLAGGTLDVYPLYLFLDGGLTLNAAISVMGEVSVETRDDRRISICSLDSGFEEEHPELDDMTFGGSLDLVKRALRYYSPPCGVNVTLRSEAPHGSGLGASSALLMALSRCLDTILGSGLDEVRIIDLGANIEAQVIGVPTGKQDYVPPLFGGVCAIHFNVEGLNVHRLDDDTTDGDLVELLNERLILTFTNINRFSGATNWAMMKAFIDRVGGTPGHLTQIKQVAEEMQAALILQDMDAFADLLAIEWENRKRLAAGVTNDEIDAQIAAAAAAGARASKICGAGGGGCMITCAEPADRAAVESALTAAGATVMPFEIKRDGLHLVVEDDEVGLDAVAG